MCEKFPTLSSTRENQNITSTEFRSIVKKLGLDYLPQYELREKLIDDQLLYYRNTIAHGERIHEEVDDYPGTYKLLSEKIIEILESLRDQMTESIRRKTYLASTASFGTLIEERRFTDSVGRK